MDDPTGFAKLPAWLLAMKPPAHAVHLYAVLYLEADWRTGTLQMAHAEMVERSGMSLATVKRMLKWLKANDVVAWVPQMEGTIQVANLYRLTVDNRGVSQTPRFPKSFPGGLTDLHTSLTDDSSSERRKSSRSVDCYTSPLEMSA